MITPFYNRSPMALIIIMLEHLLMDASRIIAVSQGLYPLRQRPAKGMPPVCRSGAESRRGRPQTGV